VSGIDFLPYGVFTAVILGSILALVLLGAQAWVVPVVALPPAVGYILYDRRLKRQGERAGG
jgi:integral membrane sensor domain MASE1